MATGQPCKVILTDQPDRVILAGYFHAKSYSCPSGQAGLADYSGGPARILRRACPNIKAGLPE